MRALCDEKARVDEGYDNDLYRPRSFSDWFDGLAFGRLGRHTQGVKEWHGENTGQNVGFYEL